MITHLAAIAAGAAIVVVIQRTWRRVSVWALSRGDY
jgi:hypothetical protein